MPWEVQMAAMGWWRALLSLGQRDAAIGDVAPGLRKYLKLSRGVPGWTVGAEAAALARTSFEAPDGAIIVEVGSFFGRGSVLLAGGRKLRGSGKLHCVDPFDASGDAFSVPHYEAILARHPGRSLRQHFDATIRRAGLTAWVEPHQGTAQQVGAGWTMPIDMLFLDGDQSPAGARAAYDAFVPWLKPGGVIALHNSNPREYDPEHEGYHRLVVEEIFPPRYVDITLADSTTFARKVGDA